LSSPSVILEVRVEPIGIVGPRAGRPAKPLTGGISLRWEWLHRHRHLLPVGQANLGFELDYLAVDDATQALIATKHGLFSYMTSQRNSIHMVLSF
jgi:hypothetical protein